MQILNFDEYSKNEIFGFLKKKYEGDEIAKERFQQMLDNIDQLNVRFIYDSKREVKFNPNVKKEQSEINKSNKDHESSENEEESEQNEEPSEKEVVKKPKEDKQGEKEFSVSQKVEVQESKILSFENLLSEELRKFQGPRKKVVQNKRRFETEYTKTGLIYISVMKRHSEHRLSSKILGSTKESSYSLAINGEHFVSQVKGKEGQPLVNPNLTEMYWNFLTELGQLQIKRKRNNITQQRYDDEVKKLHTKYTNLLKKIK